MGSDQAGDKPLEEVFLETIRLEDIPEDGQQLLIEYAGIPKDQLVEHRNEGWKTSPMPCVGRLRFLYDKWPAGPYFLDSWLEKLRAGATLLNVGAGYGQETRFLIWKYKIDPEQLYTLDLDPNLLEQGYVLFNDRESKASYFAADMLHPEDSAPLQKLTGQLDLIQAAQFFHCFGWDGQLAVSKTLAALTRGPGSMIGGNQMGSKVGGTRGLPGGFKVTEFYAHSHESLTELWDQVGQETGTRWKVEYGIAPSKALEFVDRLRAEGKPTPGHDRFKGVIMIWWLATRLE